MQNNNIELVDKIQNNLIEIRELIDFYNTDIDNLITFSDTLDEMQEKSRWIYHNILWNRKYKFHFTNTLKKNGKTDDYIMQIYYRVYKKEFIYDIRTQLLEQFKIFDFLFYITINDDNSTNDLNLILESLCITIERLYNFLREKEYKIYDEDFSIEQFFSDYKKFISKKKYKSLYLKYLKDTSTNIDIYLDISKREKEQFFWKYQTVKWLGGAFIGFFISTLLHYWK